jgi:hypothetical protein
LKITSVLGAATACSKPVSDLGWRPHGEHVGQTGKPVATNLYIAIGISGAIQHIAGISSSKVKWLSIMIQKLRFSKWLTTESLEMHLISFLG